MVTRLTDKGAPLVRPLFIAAEKSGQALQEALLVVNLDIFLRTHYQ